ncbi:hypothetical protein L6452_18612 [Arctium lappa]|uniref:Uncharacterized protein n=1 Tax=Arctium lappa TaxID=4217 RepID=A0ACB9C6T7_ARCLA|nr:hypothetical protein L6452_18612 [Arctium lappa]
MPFVPSTGANLSVQRRTLNDVFPTMMFMLPYKPNNYFVDFDKIKIHPVIRAILRDHPLAPALTSCADVPEVYLQQAWHSILKNELVRPHRFDLHIDQFDSFLSYKRLRLILELPEPNSRPGRTSYDNYPSELDVLEGIRNLGYIGDLDRVSQFDKSNLPPVWYALFSILNRCLTSKHSGMDNASLHYLRLFHVVVYDLHVDYTYIFWTELSERVQDKLTNKKRKFIPFARFMKLIVRSMLQSNSAIPRRLSWPQVPDTEMTCIQKQKWTFDYSVPIPYELIVNYADPSDDNIIQYCLEHDLSLAAGQAEPSRDEQAESFHAELAVQADVADQPIGDVLAAIDTDPANIVHDAAAATTDDANDGDEDGDRDADVGTDGDDDDDDDGDDADDDQPAIRVLHREIRAKDLNEPVVVMSDEEYSQGPATSLSEIPSSATPTSVVEPSSVQARDPAEKFMTLNEVISQMSERFEEQKNEEIQKMRAIFKGKMPEIDTTMIPPENPFRRPSGVDIRESSTTVSTMAPTIVSIPLPRPFTQSVGVSTSTRPPVSSSTLVQDLPISELSDMLYARLLSMSPPEQQDKDLISLLRNFQTTPPQASTSAPDRISVLHEEFTYFRTEARSNFSEIKEGLYLLTQALTALSDRIDRHEQSCRFDAGLSHKRRHDQDDPDHRGHEGDMNKRQKVEGSSAREVQTEDEAADREKDADNVQDCSVEDLLNKMIENVDLSSMSNVLNISEENIENNMQIVVYVDPDTASRVNELDNSEVANDMRSFFANFIEINSDDDDDIRYEKICKVKEEEYEDIIVLSDTEENDFFLDAKDEEITNTLYGDLPSQDEIPEATPDTSCPVADQAPTTIAPSRTFEVDPYGVIYRNGSSQNCFFRFEEINHYSDGTLKVIKLQLEQRLKAVERRFLETRRNAFQLENDEIQLLKKTLNIIGEKLIFRSTLRRLEVLIGLNRLRQREERQ